MGAWCRSTTCSAPATPPRSSPPTTVTARRKTGWASSRAGRRNPRSGPGSAGSDATTPSNGAATSSNGRCAASGYRPSCSRARRSRRWPARWGTRAPRPWSPPSARRRCRPPPLRGASSDSFSTARVRAGRCWPARCWASGVGLGAATAAAFTSRAFATSSSGWPAAAPRYPPMRSWASSPGAGASPCTAPTAPTRCHCPRTSTAWSTSNGNWRAGAAGRWRSR